MTSGDGDRWARDMMMTLSAVWDHKKPHGSENSYQPILTANWPASSLCPKTPTGEWRTISFETGRWPDSVKMYIFCSLFHLQDWLHILKLCFAFTILQLSAQCLMCSLWGALNFTSLNHLSSSWLKYACHCCQAAIALLQICHFVLPFSWTCMFFLFFFNLFSWYGAYVRGLGAHFMLLLVSSPRHLSIFVQWKLRTTAGWVIPLGSRHYFPVTGNRWGFITLELSISKQSIPLNSGREICCGS